MVKTLYSFAKRLKRSPFSTGHNEHREPSLLSRYPFDMDSIRQHWLPAAGDQDELSDFRAFDRRVMMLCAGRTGSQLLCYLMQDFGFQFVETTNCVFDVLGNRPPQGKATVREYMQHLIDTASPGRFGVKGIAEAAIPFFLYNEWPKYIDEWKIVRIKRRNVVRQAISLLIALKTNQWEWHHKPAGTVTDDDYDFEKILWSMEMIVDANNKIERLISYLGVDALTVYYEDLAADTRGVTDKVGKYLDLERTGTAALEGMTARPKPNVQSTELNKRWEERFHEDLSSRDPLAELRAVAA